MKQWAVIIGLLLASLSVAGAGTTPKSGLKGGVVREPSKGAVAYAKQEIQGYSMKVWISNQMCLGLQAWDAGSGDQIPEEPHFGLEYPAGTGIEHLYGAGPWIGGKVNGSRRVTEGYNGDNAEKWFRPDPKHPLRELIWHTSTKSLDEPNKRGVDDDGDGKIDEDDLDGLDNDGDWVDSLDDTGADGIPDSLESGCRGGYNKDLNPDPAYDNYAPLTIDKCHPDALGNFRRMNDKDVYTEHNHIPDHGERHVDEDYAAISDRDFYCSATDTAQASGHFPLGVKVIQKSYAWSGAFAEGILPFDYYFINIGKNVITDAYVAFFADMDVGPVNVPNYFQHDYSCYFDSLRTAFIHNPVDRGSTPLGITVLKTPRPLDQLTFIYKWFDFANPTPGTNDSLLYAWMSGEAFPTQPIAPCQSPNDPTDTRFFFSFGPFQEFKPGDTLKISVALIGGDGVDEGPNNLKDNAQKALKLLSRGFRSPVIPPSPKIKVTEGFRKVTLQWGASVGLPDPIMDSWDDSSKLAETFPDTSWRRTNPPCNQQHLCVDGKLPGGRIFEGYRLYRSQDPSDAPDPNSWTLLKQWDIAGDDYAYNVGLQEEFVDSNLATGQRYWYAVTTFGIPDLSIVERQLSGGTVIFDSLYTDPLESAKEDSRVKVDLQFSASNTLGEVLVVPNPYRLDQDYTFENGGWEGPGADWQEKYRLIRFIHLPRKCTIRVFTLVGDQVVTLHYEAPTDKPDVGQLDWNLLSESGRTLASGLYVFSVESDLGTQIGKFALIR
jgi:hypothetical protein